MTREEIIRTLSEHRAELTEMGVRSLALFGSVARNEAKPGSDIDLLADLEPPYTYDRYIQVKILYRGFASATGRSSYARDFNGTYPA